MVLEKTTALNVGAPTIEEGKKILVEALSLRAPWG